MSEFKQAVLQAKKQAQKTRLYYAAGTALAIVLILLFLLISRGTRIAVLPAEIADQADLTSESLFAFVIGEHLYSLVAEAPVTATAEGFHPQTRQLSHADFGKVTTLTLEPLPTQLLLKSSAGDDRTSWRINGELVAVAPMIEKELEPGDYTIGLSHPFFEDHERAFSLGRGEVVEETITLNPIIGTLNINSRPAGAAVTVNGTEYGETPTTVTLNGGQHTVTVTKPGFDLVEDRVELKREQTNPERNYRLEPKSAGVIVSVSPAGGSLTLNGVNVSASSKIKVKSGQKSTLRYQKAGYFAQSQTFTLEPEQVVRYALDLEKEMGTVTVRSNLPASVYINGNAVGTTPFETALQAVSHKLEVKAPGYRSINRDITPKASTPTKLDVTLLPEKEARLAEAAKSYKTQAGGEMVLFKVNDSVLMGAERGEPGQRANEFIRTGLISKAFYAGRYEVTNAEYAKFDSTHSGPANEPATNLSWFDAARYANWLSTAEGLQAVYKLNGNQLLGINPKADGYRMLAESEWEWLARKAGRKNQSLFAWGDAKTLPVKAANIADESVKGSVKVYVPRYNDGYTGKSPVGVMQREQSGLFDMGGNVSEWTHDSYDLVPPAKGSKEPHVLDTRLGLSRVVKGGNWQSGSITELRASYREGMESASNTVGFRLGRFVYGGDE